MPVQSTGAPVLSKRDQLKQIVATLGENADAARIREEAYRVGFGQVNGTMLIKVRNELWPNRAKHSGGRPRGAGNVATIVGSGLLVDEAQCQQCSSLRTVTTSKYMRNGTRVARITADYVPGSVHRGRQCKDCGHRFSTVNMGACERMRRVANDNAVEKECSKCKQILPIDKFGKKGDGLYKSWCNQCFSDLSRKAAFNALLKRFDLTQEQYDAIVAAQNGVCAICLRPGKGKGRRVRPLVFDHCHETGRFRALLCDKCNLGLGNFDDNLAIMEAAVAYLKKHSSSEREAHHGTRL